MPDEKLVSEVTRRYATEWFSLPALALETPAMRVITVPEKGGKIVSIFDRNTEHEWLLPPKNGQFLPVSYGAVFVEQDMSGWDEMFPTIDHCVYPAPGAYFDADLPDHGEVWSLPWQVDLSSSNAICLSVEGHTLPYVLSRELRFIDERTLRFSYEVFNAASEPLYVLWAAHPQFATNDAMRIVLPIEVTQVISVKATREFPLIGQQLDWTAATTPAGLPLQLDCVRPPSTQAHRKLYLPPDQPAAWAGLQQGENGAWLRLSWDPSVVPYLGIWVDEGSYNPASTAALEPSTGYYDSLMRAWQNQRVMTLIPGIPQRWSLDLELGSGQI